MLISTVPAPKKHGDDQAIGRSRGGLRPKIHTHVDAVGNPIGFHLTGDEAHDLVGVHDLLPDIPADTLTADKESWSRDFGQDVKLIPTVWRTGDGQDDTQAAQC